MFSIWLNVLPSTLLRHAAQVEEITTFPIWLTIPLFVTLIGLIVYGMVKFFKAAQVIVGELEVATIFDKKTGNFKKFLEPGVYWINPFRVREGDRIPLGNQNTSGQCESLRTKEGIPLTIDYNVSFSMNPFDSLPAIHYKMARALPKYAPNMVAGKVKHVLRHLVEQKSIDELYEKDAVKVLEKEVREEVSRRNVAVGMKELGANDMKLGPIRMPTQVEKALKSDYERKLQTRTSIQALEHLHEVVSKFDERDMKRLSELERLRVAERNGSQVYLVDSLVKGVQDLAIATGDDKSKPSKN